MAVVAVTVELPWTQGTLVSSGPVELPWTQGTLVASNGNPFTPIDPPVGSTPTGPNLDADFVLPAQDVYDAVHELVVTDLRDDTEVELLTFSIAQDDGSACWTLNGTVAGTLFASLTAPGDPPVFRISLDGLEWVFIIEGIRRSRQFPSTDLSITGRSLTITAGAPYEFSRNWVNEGPASAAQLIDQAQLLNGMESVWMLDDWLVPDRVWTFAGTPFEVARRVAQAVDAVVLSDRTENRIYITPRYRELPNEWPTVVPNVEIHIDAAMVDSYERADKPAYNAIYCSGQQQGALAYVHLAGTLGDKLAPLVTDLLLTDVDACRQRGVAELGKGGPGALVQMTLPILTGGTMPGVIDVGALCRVVEESVTWWGVVRSQSVSVTFPSAVQSITLERHTGAIEGTEIVLPSPPPPAPTGFVWLDTFTGAAGALFGHVPDVKPTGWAWAANDLELDGAGSAVAPSTAGSADAGGTWAPIGTGSAWRIELDVTMTDEPSVMNTYANIYLDDGTSPNALDFYVYRAGDSGFSVQLYYGDGSGDAVVAAAGAHSFVVEISGATAIAKMDGATVLTVTATGGTMSEIARFSLYFDLTDGQAHSIQRAAIKV